MNFFQKFVRHIYKVPQTKQTAEVTHPECGGVPAGLPLARPAPPAPAAGAAPPRPGEYNAQKLGQSAACRDPANC